MNKVLCIIPARSGSKSIKNKNIIKFLNKELIYYTIKFAKSLKFINKIIFTSDSKLYIKIAKMHRSEFNHLREKKLSGDSSLTTSLVKHLLNLESKHKNKYDFVLVLQPTSPFRLAKDFYKAYRYLRNKSYDSAITVSKSTEHPYRMKIFKNNQSNTVSNFVKLKKESLVPRQKLSSVYIRAGSMYFSRVRNLYKNNSLVGRKVLGIIVKDKYSLNIDTKEDLILANYYFYDKNKKKSN